MTFKSYGVESSRVLISLHGFMGDGGDWEVFAEGFTAQMPTWHVLAPTLPGHENAPTQFEESTFERSLTDWMDSRKIPTAAIAGYSLGGRLALRLALDNPRRFPVFVGISTTAGIEDPVERDARRIADLSLAQRLRACVDRSSFEDFLEEWWALPVFASRQRNDADREAFLDSRLKKFPAALADALEHWSPGVIPSEWERLGEYRGRCLLLNGGDDLKYAGLTLRMHAAFKSSQVFEFGGAGHQLLVERPGEVAETVARFLNEEQSEASE